jgi:2-succinyl-5-enolpyruvyl-6-hydroxy-3-cyclohexene-1-carboxylate synthase
MQSDTRMNVALVSTDERSGAFAALGVAKARAVPVAIVTTSGSAVANLLPALVEADASGIPLVVVSCDRPRQLRGMGFGQMADHLGATVAATRAQADLDDPADTPGAVARARSLIDGVLRQMSGSAVPEPNADGHTPARRAAPGPVHLNVPFAGVYDALETLPVSDETIAAARAPLVDERSESKAIHAPGIAWSCGEASSLAGRIEALRARRRANGDTGGATPRGTVNGLIVAGAEPGAPCEAILAFASMTGYPILADVGSGLRAHPSACAADATTGDGALVLNPFDALGARSRIAGARCELIVRFGLAPVLPTLHEFLKAHADVPVLKVAASADERDYLHPGLDPRDRLTDIDAQALRTVGEHLCVHAGAASEAWRERWAGAAMHGMRARRACVTRLVWGEVPAAHQVLRAEGFDFLHIGNSMSVRHADIGYEVRPSRQDVYVSRGVSGIDGTVSTFLGEALVRRQPGLLLVGDQALLHDLSALAAAQRVDTPACVCVMNNQGGAIFDYLPVASEAGYVSAIRNPHGVDYAALAQAFGLGYRRADSCATLDEALVQSRDRAGVTLVEIAVPPHSGIVQMHMLTQAVAAQ